MSFWKTLFGLKKNETTETTDAQAIGPVFPFENWTDDTLLGRRLFRPLVYLFEHATLPQVLFTNHPELGRLLSPAPTGGSALSYFWSKSAALCESCGYWPDGLTDSDAASGEYFQYVGQFEDLVITKPSFHGSVGIWTVTMPPPKAIGEAHFVALCCQVNESHQHIDASPDRRYFTLERSVDPETTCFCEWTAAGTHQNHGTYSVATLAAFEHLVVERLSLSGAIA